MVVNYLLEGDYEETGFVTVHSTLGHQYNYIKADGIYYFVDFTDFTSENGRNSEAKFELCRLLQDKLNGYDNKEHIKEYKEYFDNYLNTICFWSGKSLDDPSATKAALIHDTYMEKNNRDHLDWGWTEENTSYIWATKYYEGMEGSNISFLVEDCNQGANTLKSDILNYNGISYKLNYLAISHPEYTKYQTLYIDSTGKRMGAPFKEIAPVELRLVPFFCEVSPEAQKIIDSQETYMEKMYRQMKGNSETPVIIEFSDTEKSTMDKSYQNKFSPFNKEVRIGSLWAWQRFIDYTCIVEGRMSLDEFAKMFDMENFYGTKLVKR